MKSFAERNPIIIGTVGIVAVAGVVVAALQYQKLPFLNQGKNVSAYFADAGGLRTGNGVEVSGYPVGKVSSIELDGAGVLVKFKVGKNIRLGDRTEVAIKTKGLLGSKILDVIPRGGGQLEGPIPGLLRRGPGQAQRSHLQRGLDAARLRSASCEYAGAGPTTCA